LAINDWLSRRAALSPDRVALIAEDEGGAEITYAAWNRAANQTARFLAARLGVSKGDRVAVLAHNSPRVLDLWFACGKLGAVFVPLSWRLTAAELAPLLEELAPKALLFGPEHAEAARALAPAAGALAALEDDRGPSLSAREAEDAGPLKPAAVDPEDPWLILYTGGTTGAPKGALLSYRAVAANAANTALGWGLGPEDVAALNAPLFHTGGLNVFTAPLVYAGGASVVCRAFRPEAVFELLSRRGLTLLFGVPTMHLALQEHPRFASADLSRLRLLISGGAPCPLPIFERFWARGVAFRTGYGLTEAGPNNFVLPGDPRAKPGAVGVPLLHVDARLVDAEGRPVPRGEVGELELSGPHLFSGYFRREAETARILAGGWLKTGDLAREDEDGFFSIAGRSKDVIISGGEKIFPAEVESAIAAHPSVAEVALIGVPDPRWGESPRAVIVLRPGAELAPKELAAHCLGKVARYRTPRSVVFAAELPKTSAGKIDKRALAASYGGDFAGAEPLP
jgi:fatty-acyl-CoA synthase